MHCRQTTVPARCRTNCPTLPALEAIARSIAHCQQNAHHAVYRQPGLLFHEQGQVDSLIVQQPASVQNSALLTLSQKPSERHSEDHSSHSSLAVFQPRYTDILITSHGQVQQCSSSETTSNAAPGHNMMQQHSASDANLPAHAQATYLAKAVKAVTIPVGIIAIGTLIHHCDLSPQDRVTIAQHVWRTDDLTPHELQLLQDLKVAAGKQLMALASYHAPKLLPKQCHKAESNVQDSKSILPTLLNKLVQWISSPVYVQICTCTRLKIEPYLKSNTAGKCPHVACRIIIRVSTSYCKIEAVLESTTLFTYFASSLL